MIVDGKILADEIKAELSRKLKTKSLQLRLAVVLVGDNIISEKYAERKKKIGEEIGIEVIIHELVKDISQADLEEETNKLVNDERVNGIIVQLPLPKEINKQKIFDLIPANKDVDALGKDARVLSPTVSAIKEILERNKISPTGKKAVILGKGKLVGRPVAIWLTQAGANISVIDSKTINSSNLLKTADIIVSGVGKPGLIASDKIREGVILIDAGTSEVNGQLRGDANPTCALKCSLFTPVPGGVGPLTVVMLFKNLLELNS